MNAGCSAKWIQLMDGVVLLWRIRWRLVEDKRESGWCWWIRRWRTRR